MRLVQKFFSTAACTAYSWTVIALVLAIHLLPIFAFFTPFYGVDALLCIASYTVRVFCLTAGYHRYFAHKAFETNRIFQFLLAYGAACSLQGGPLWWASHHRYHHHHADQDADSHSPRQQGFFYSHFLWFMQKKHLKAHYHLIKDFSRYPELRLLERYWYLSPLPILIILYFFGGWNYVIWGFFVPTMLVNNVTYCVNSCVHLFGTRRYATQDNSKNNWWVALLTFGEGWHNNHHRYAGAAQQGFAWYQIDITYYCLKFFSYLRIIKNIKMVPKKILAEGGYSIL